MTSLKIVLFTVLAQNATDAQMAITKASFANQNAKNEYNVALSKIAGADLAYKMAQDIYAMKAAAMPQAAKDAYAQLLLQGDSAYGLAVKANAQTVVDLDFSTSSLNIAVIYYGLGNWGGAIAASGYAYDSANGALVLSTNATVGGTVATSKYNEAMNLCMKY